MHADPLRARWAGLMLVLALLGAGCASVTPPRGRGMNLHYTPSEATGPALSAGPSDASPPALASPRHSPSETAATERLHRRRGSREAVTAADPGGEEGNARLSALAAHLAFLRAVDEVSASSRRVSSELSRLKSSDLGIVGAGNGIFVTYVDHGERQLRWIDAELAAATRLATAASKVEDPDMQLALLRLAGPRLEAAMMGSILLAVWFDFLNLTDDVLSRRLYSVERLYVDMERFQKMLEPAMKAFSSLEPGQLEQAHHQAIHGGGNWTLGRTWPGEWNRMIMEALRKAESTTGRMLTRNEVLEIVAENMKEYKIPMNFIRWRGR